MADTKQKLPTPAWFKWLMLAFIGYVMVSNMFHAGTPSGDAAQMASDDRAASNQQALKNIFDFEDFSNKLFPGFMPAFYKQDVEAGTGAQAYCGQRAALRVTEQVNDGKPGASGKMEGVIGGHAINLAVEQAVEGMRVGGKRRVIAYAHQVMDEATLAARKLKARDKLTYVIELLSITPPAPESAMPLKVIDEKIGNEGGLRCGDRARVQLAIWKADGTEVLNTHKNGYGSALEVVLGETAFGLQEGVQKMRIGGKRLLIIPPAHQKPLMQHATNATDEVLSALNGKEAVIVEVTLLPEAPAPSAP